MRQIQIVDTGTQFGMDTNSIFKSWHPHVANPKGLNDFTRVFKQADLVLLGGGADVHPSVYGHTNHYSHVGPSLSPRDWLEREIWKMCQQHKIPVLGICRGAQFVCVMSGGYLIQHCNGHAGPNHMITMEDGSKCDMTSVHHQMMVPYRVKNHQVLGWTVAIADRYEVDYTKVADLKFEDLQAKEPEIVLFPDQNALAIQGHPEYMDDDTGAVKLTKRLVKKLLLKDNVELAYGV